MLGSGWLAPASSVMVSHDSPVDWPDERFRAQRIAPTGSISQPCCIKALVPFTRDQPLSHRASGETFSQRQAFVPILFRAVHLGLLMYD